MQMTIKVVGRAKQPTKKTAPKTKKEVAAKPAWWKPTKKKESLAKTKSNHEPTHSQICLAIVDYMRSKRPDKLFIHIANEGKRSPMQGKKLKDEGLLPGVYDYFLAHSIIEDIGDGTSMFTPGLFVEVKAKKDRLSKAQKEFRERALKAHYAVAEVYSIDEFIAVIEEFLKADKFKELVLKAKELVSNDSVN